MDATALFARVLHRMARTPLASLAGAAALALAVAVSPALGQQAPAPSPTPGADVAQPPPPPAPPPAPAVPAVPATPPATGSTVRQELRFGATGSSVKALQRALRTRGIRVPVDGAYGARTRAGVRILQRKLRVKPTGIADAAVLSRLGVKVRSIASGTTSTAGAFTGYPVPEPNDITPSATGFVWPANGMVSSLFGPRWGRMHEGIDIAAPTGRPVRAAKGGTVITAAAAGAYGNLVVIDHGNGETTRYGHLSAFDVAQGAIVAQAQVIGRVGSTGRSTGPHLHFEVRFTGVATDPLRHL
jgi:murein DD-endopeptidase MepM/ murein hydrolase activator NlpD